jgi:hypothetical protein
MIRTSLMLPADLKARATRTAREHGISFGELVRRSLRAAVDAPATAYDDPVFADEAVFDGPAPTDLAAEHDGYLYGDGE